MGRRVASGLQVQSGAGADANTWEAMETEMAGVMGKLKETAGLEAEMVVGTESGVDTEAGMDLESTADWSGVVVGAEVSVRRAIMTTRGDARVDMRSTVAGTAAGNGAEEVTGV